MRVTPPDLAGVRQFQAADFVRSADTLHSLSKERDGADAGPLITALTATIREAAEDCAKASPNSRLPCRWLSFSSKQQTCAAGTNCQTFTPTTAHASSTA